MKLRLATDADKPFLYALWQEAFGDEEETISLFFDRCFHPQNTLLAEIDETPVAALYLLDAELVSGAKTYALSYVYAAATKTSARKSGVMTALLSFAQTVAKKRNKDALYLVPADEALFHYYGKRGYQNAFLKESVTIPRETLASFTAEASKECACTLENYAKARETALQTRMHIRYPASVLDLSLAFSNAFGAKMMLFQNGCFQYELEQDRAEVTDFCAQEKAESGLLKALLLKTDAKTFTLHAPKGVFTALGMEKATQTYAGMLLPLNDCIKQENTDDAYLGITLG